jgi:hypothetical protein
VKTGKSENYYYKGLVTCVEYFNRSVIIGGTSTVEMWREDRARVTIQRAATAILDVDTDVLIGNQEGCLYLYHYHGKKIRQFQDKAAIQCMVELDIHTIVVGTSKCISIWSKTGRRVQTITKFNSSPVALHVDEDKIFFVCKDNHLRCYRSEKRKPKTIARLPGFRGHLAKINFFYMIIPCTDTVLVYDTEERAFASLFKLREPATDLAVVMFNEY